MNLLEKKTSNFDVISIDGRLDTTNYNDFDKRISEIIEGGETNLVFNCAGLDYISSSGLRVFLSAQKKINALKGKLNLCEMRPHIKEIFDISGFSNIFIISGTEEEALNG
jgi:anti-anti-sigma factor